MPVVVFVVVVVVGALVGKSDVPHDVGLIALRIGTEYFQMIVAWLCIGRDYDVVVMHRSILIARYIPCLFEVERDKLHQLFVIIACARGFVTVAVEIVVYFYFVFPQKVVVRHFHLEMYIFADFQDVSFGRFYQVDNGLGGISAFA